MLLAIRADQLYDARVRAVRDLPPPGASDLIAKALAAAFGDSAPRRG